MSQPALPPAAAGSGSAPRPLTAVDDDLRSCRSIRRDAERELTEVRRRQQELADLEATLLVTIDCRSRLVDHLLDERLRAVPTDAGSLALLGVGTPAGGSPEAAR